MNTKKTLAGFVLLITIATASVAALGLQGTDEAARAARELAQREALAREDKAQRDWLNKEQAKSESNLDRRIKDVAPFRGRENETKFLALRQSTEELVDLSRKINEKVNASGAQSIAISFYSDLDQIEKLVKAIRKSAK